MFNVTKEMIIYFRVSNVTCWSRNLHKDKLLA